MQLDELRVAQSARLGCMTRQDHCLARDPYPTTCVLDPRIEVGRHHLRSARDHVGNPPMPSIRHSVLIAARQNIKNSRLDVRDPFHKKLEAKSRIRTKIRI